LRFSDGASLEDLIVRHALGREVPLPARESAAAGVMMIPIPRAGVLEEVTGLDEARAVEFIDEIRLTIATGQRLVPLPEGARYLGFIFARAPSPEQVEGALRSAHSCLRIRVNPERESSDTLAV
jgi:hypothetical protein